MITLTLLHPVQSNPVRSWTFRDESVIRIGRATDNHVVLYSAVVSRHHVELRRQGAIWEVVNLGCNGTYTDGEPITHIPAVHGLIIHLARSGPKLQILLQEKVSPVSGHKTTTLTTTQETLPLGFPKTDSTEETLPDDEEKTIASSHPLYHPTNELKT